MKSFLKRNNYRVILFELLNILVTPALVITKISINSNYSPIQQLNFFKLQKKSVRIIPL